MTSMSHLTTLVTHSDHAQRKVNRTARDAGIYRRHLPAWVTSTSEDKPRAECQNRGARIAIFRSRQIRLIRCVGVSDPRTLLALKKFGGDRPYDRSSPEYREFDVWMREQREQAQQWLIKRKVEEAEKTVAELADTHERENRN